MPTTPFIPETITVHLGPPDSPAQNVMVNFVDYLKSVAASEIYPTWPENAIRANIYAQISFALNRVYTEWYRSRGYDFDITNTTAFDQAYTYGRDTFQTTDRIVEEIFNDYIVRQGFIEPLLAQILFRSSPSTISLFTVRESTRACIRKSLDTIICSRISHLAFLSEPIP